LDAVTWSREGVGGPELRIDVIRSLIADNLDRFIDDYLSLNPKQSAKSNKDESKKPDR
jgi:hypothetical protein